MLLFVVHRGFFIMLQIFFGEYFIMDLKTRLKLVKLLKPLLKATEEMLYILLDVNNLRLFVPAIH